MMKAQTELLNSSRAVLLNAVSAWISEGMKNEGRLERANKRMLATLTQHLDLKVVDSIPDEPQTPAEKLESAVVAGYMSIMGMLTSIRECEHYFRRYPFKNRGISRADYLRNCCEMLFDRIAQLRDRLKISLNAIQKQRPSANLPIGKIIKAFDRTFRTPLRLRNRVHHHDRYSDPAVDQLGVVDLLEKASILNPGDKEVKEGAIPLMTLLNRRTLYRKAARDWLRRIDEYEKAAEIFVDVVSQIILDECEFIQKFISEDDKKRLKDIRRYKIGA